MVDGQVALYKNVMVTGDSINSIRLSGGSIHVMVSWLYMCNGQVALHISWSVNSFEYVMVS